MSGFFGLLFQEGKDSSGLPYFQQGFGERLKRGFLSRLWIPHLSGLRIDLDLIPFIENAFKFGINPEMISSIRINLDISGQEFHMKVTNLKHDLAKDHEKSQGLGIGNAHRENETANEQCAQGLDHDSGSFCARGTNPAGVVTRGFAPSTWRPDRRSGNPSRRRDGTVLRRMIGAQWQSDGSRIPATDPAMLRRFGNGEANRATAACSTAVDHASKAALIH